MYCEGILSFLKIATCNSQSAQNWYHNQARTHECCVVASHTSTLPFFTRPCGPLVAAAPQAARSRSRMAQASRPRNSRLRNFYGLEGGAPDPARGIPAGGREAALAYAEGLTRDLGLADLLGLADRLRREAEAGEKGLYGAVVSMYGEMGVAVGGAAAVPGVVEALLAKGGGVEGAVEAAERCQRVSEALEGGRREVERLEGGRRCALLLEAAAVLERSIEADYRGLVDLCTDPEAAWRRLDVTAMRCSAVMPVLEKLGESDDGFRDAWQRVHAVAVGVREDLENRMSSGTGDVDGLSLLDAIRLRRLLGEGKDELRGTFLRACELRLETKAAGSAAFETAVGVGVAAYHLKCARDVVLPEVIRMIDMHASMFAGAGAGDGNACDAESADDFAVWLTGVVGDVVGARVRRAAAAPTSDSQEDLEEFGSALSALKSAADAVSSASVGGTAAQVDVIFGSLCDSLRTEVVELKCQSAHTRWRDAVSDMLTRDYDPSEGSATMDKDVTTLMETITAAARGAESVSHALQPSDSRGAELPLHEIITHIMQHIDEAIGMAQARAMARASAICNGLSDASPSGRALQQTRQQLTADFATLVTTLAVDLLQQADEARLESGVSRGASSAITLLQCARHEHELCTLRTRGVHLEDDGGFRGVAWGVGAAWSERLRGDHVHSAAAARGAQLDAAAVAAAVELPWLFERVARAARERCAERVAPLSETEARRLAGV